jgi:hypothetical protein
MEYIDMKICSKCKSEMVKLYFTKEVYVYHCQICYNIEKD